MTRYGPILAAFALVAVTASPLAAQQYVKAGLLSCNTSANVGLIFGSRQTMSCRFTPDNPGRYPENYYGTITRLGLDIGFTAGGVMLWAVFAPSSGYPPGVLGGNYVGASGEVSLGLGAGANVLVGGSNRTVSLQPLSVEGQVGVNLAVGVAGLELRPAQ